MSTFEAIVLGIVQGLTEFLPISSSGHLRVVPAFAGWDDPGAGFTAVIQLGTLLAVLIYFRRDLWNIARAWVAQRITPHVEGWEAAGAVPRELFRDAGKEGIFGWKVPRDAGGH